MRLACLALLCAFGCSFGVACSDHERRVAPDAGQTFGNTLQPDLPTRDGDGIKIGAEASPVPGTRPIVDDGSVPGFAGNHSFESAVWIEPDGDPPIANEHSADQVDYFAFRGKGGSYYSIQTEAGAYHPNNVLTLYDNERRAIASNDVGSIWPGDEIDARLVVRLPHDGDYYVKVEDLNTTADEFTSDFFLLYYHLTLRSITPQTPGYAFWGGSSRKLDNYLVDDALHYSWLTVVGEALTPSQEFTFEGLGDNILVARVLAGGVDGNGSSVQRGRASVLDPSGAVLAQINRQAHDGDIRPPVSAGENRFRLEHDGELGSNAFFAVDLVLLKENPREQREPANGTPAGAETIPWSFGTRGRGVLLSMLPVGDVDYYAIPAQQGGFIGVVCEAQTSGSGVRGLVGELRGPNDERMGASADVDQGLQLNAIVGAAGTYYLRLSSAGVADALPWVRCAVVTG